MSVITPQETANSHSTSVTQPLQQAMPTVEGMILSLRPLEHGSINPVAPMTEMYLLKRKSLFEHCML